MSYTDRDRVTEQYRAPTNLNARIKLHQRFSTNRYGWTRWVFDQIELTPEARLLELGCGPGGLWTESLDRLPDGWSITLTDLSKGMVREAESRLGTDRRFDFRAADAQELPFEDRIFDAVIANHMLYHVPDRPKALGEISRVLRSSSTLYAATNGMRAQQEMGSMRRILDPSHAFDGPSKDPLAFNLENGSDQLAPHFCEVEPRRYEDSLAVTEAQPLVDYLLSSPTAQALRRKLSGGDWDKRVRELSESVEQELAEHGVIHISKDSGMFVARK